LHPLLQWFSALPLASFLLGKLISGYMKLFMAVGLLAALAAGADPRVCALRGKNLAQLKEICTKASVPHEDGDEEEKLRSLLFEFMQNELPESVRPKGTPLEKWPGPGEPDECDPPAAAAKPAAKPAAGGDGKPKLDLDNMAASLFGRLDANSDGVLSREEMKGMIDSVNAAARAKGEPEHDLFKTLDRDLDGKVSRSEADETFKAMAAGQAPGGAKKVPSRGGSKLSDEQVLNAASDEQAMGDMMFKALDADKDGRLSKAEMESVLAQYAADAKSRGEEQSDFWASLDANSDGYADKTETSAFFAAMVAAISKDGGKGGGKEEL